MWQRGQLVRLYPLLYDLSNICRKALRIAETDVPIRGLIAALLSFICADIVGVDGGLRLPISTSALPQKDFWKARPFVSCHFNPFMTHHTCRAILNSDCMVYMGHPAFTALSLIRHQTSRSSLGCYVPWTGLSRSLRSQCSSHIFWL